MRAVACRGPARRTVLSVKIEAVAARLSPGHTLKVLSEVKAWPGKLKFSLPFPRDTEMETQRVKTSGLIITALAGAALASAAPALGQATIKAGTLTCRGGAGVGLVLGSQKTYGCRYVSASGKLSEKYEASVTRIGLDLGVTNEAVIVWTVLSSSDKLADRALEGNYVGASADVAVGVGGGANVLVVGSNDSIELQPLSVEGQTGLNLAVGVAEMKLR